MSTRKSVAIQINAKTKEVFVTKIGSISDIQNILKGDFYPAIQFNNGDVLLVKKPTPSCKFENLFNYGGSSQYFDECGIIVTLENDGKLKDAVTSCFTAKSNIAFVNFRKTLL